MNLTRPAAVLACALALVVPRAHARQERQQQPQLVAVDPAELSEHSIFMPFVRLAERARGLVEAGRVGPETAFDLSATAELSGDGSFEPGTLKLEWRTPAGEDVAPLMQDALTALDQSKLLRLLSGYAKVVHITARVDRENVALGLEAEGPSEAEAVSAASYFNQLLNIIRRHTKGTAEGRVNEATEVTSEGRLLRINFQMPKAVAVELVVNALDGRAARRAAPKQD